MKYFKNTLIIVALFLFGSLYAQQEPNYSLYRYSMNILNPAYAGADGKTSITGNIRSQWVNVQDAPETQSFFFAMPLGKRVGIGASVANDKTFIESQTLFNIDFSYEVPVSENAKLYLGLKAGGSTYDIDRDNLTNYSVFPVDPALDNIDTGFRPNVGVGGYLLGEKYFISLSMPSLLASDGINTNDGRVTYSTDKTHIYLSGGYDFALSDSVEFRPYTMIRYVGGSPLSVDINAAFRFFSKFELGAAYRTDEAFTGLFVVDLADWATIGYAYDGSTRSEISGISDGTHEVLFRLNL